MSFTRNKSPSYETAWAAVRERDEFTVDTICKLAGIALSTATRYAQLWIRAGLITQTGRSESGKHIYCAVDRHVAAVRLRDDLSAIPSQTQHGNMWRSMRLLGEFSPVDLAAHSSTDVVDVPLPVAEEYCRMLLQAGYLRVVQKALPGRRPARYRLISNTGPLPPRERRVRAVYDDNRGEYVYLAGGAKCPR